jgi:4-diphosphocytidyl-2-C-methyl-D-erythritol kinase
VVTVFSPAKLNLFLAVTGRRADGFHDLVSVAAPLDFGDTLEAGSREQETGNQFTMECDRAEVPVDGSNLVLKAAAAFVAATGWGQRVHFRLTKRIPIGAGMGGGSSNAVAALRALNQLAGGLLDETRLAGLAAALGSDCALFLHNAPVVMRGRGETVERLPISATDRLRGRRVLLFKPSFGISTPWAYGRMIARGTDYLPAAEAEARLARWLTGDAPAEKLLFNNMEPAAFDKYPALPVLQQKLQSEFGVAVAMSGSGSACFALLPEGAAPAPMLARIRECWGAEIFGQEGRLA